MLGYEGRRIAVLGASGFIGRWVTRKLCVAGARLYLVSRDSGRAREVFEQYGIHGEVIQADLSVAAALEDIYREIQPAMVFNLVSYGVDPSQRDETTAYRANAELLLILCASAARWKDSSWPGQHIVHTGSAAEYGMAGGDLREDGPVLPTTLYGKSKLRGTEILGGCCPVLGLRSVAARLFTIYGQGEPAGRLLPSLIEAARTGQPVELSGGAQRRDFTYVEDVAEGLLRLGLTSGHGHKAVNVATGRLTSVRDFVETGAALLGIRPMNLKFGVVSARPWEMEHDPVSLARLQELAGWIPPTHIAEGIRKSVETGLLNKTA